MKAKTFILFMALTGLIMTSCSKTEPIDTKATDAADDVVLSEALYDDAFASLEIATVFAEDAKKSASVLDSCPLITINSPGENFFPRNIVIDYGTGCTGLFDVVRSGKILITLSGPRGTAGSERVLTFDNYYVNGAKVEGTITIENLGLNNNQNAVFGVSLTGGKITFADSKVITREFTREREYIAGYGTWNPWDDKCLITGMSAGTNLEGKTYTLTIINPLEWHAACRFLVSGTIGFDVEGIEPFELDYGTGECDADATLSRGDETKQITLRYRHPKYNDI
ncbi:hypothetical protein EG830_05305 [bacterium]|nr:hypothetical protein [bacterium]